MPIAGSDFRVRRGPRGCTCGGERESKVHGNKTEIVTDSGLRRQHAQGFIEKPSLLKALFLELGLISGYIEFLANKRGKWKLSTIKEITSTLNPVRLRAIREGVRRIKTI